MVNGTVPATYTADSCLVEVCSLAGIDIGTRIGIVHAIICMLSLGWNEDDVLARTKTMGVTRGMITRVKARKGFDRWFHHYETLPDRSIEVARKLQAIGAPRAMARLLKSTFSEFESISNKAAVEIVKGSGVSSNVESKPVINVLISNELARHLNEAAKLVYKDVGDTEPLQLPVDSDEQG
jgi:hypothetical protein